MLCYGVNGNHVIELNLRETTKFLIDDKSGSKFKKSENAEYLASNKKYSNWSWSGFDIYPIDHEKPLQIIENNKRSIIASKIKKAVEEKIQKLTYAQYLNLAKHLNIDIGSL